MTGDPSEAEPDHQWLLADHLELRLYTFARHRKWLLSKHSKVELNAAVAKRTTKRRLLLVDDQPLVAEGFAALVSGE